MTILGFLIGFVLFILGFLMVWRRRNFRDYAGDLGTFFDLPGSSWLSWEVLGSVLMLIGFMTAFGVFQAFAGKILKGIIFPTLG